MKTKFTSLLCLSSLLYAPVMAAEVYTWQNASGSTSYSDVPHKLQTGRVHTVNIRTHQVKPPVKATPAGTSLADQQSALNQQITEANRKIEEQNKKMAEENQSLRADNCKAARINRQTAESARRNRDALIGRYDADIKKFCQ